MENLKDQVKEAFKVESNDIEARIMMTLKDAGALVVGKEHQVMLLVKDELFNHVSLRTCIIACASSAVVAAGLTAIIVHL